MELQADVAGVCRGALGSDPDAPHRRGRAAEAGSERFRGKAECRPLATWRRTVQMQSGRLGQQHRVLRAHAFGSRQHQPQQRQLERQTGR